MELKKIIFYTLIIISFNLFVLILPFLLFLLILSFPHSGIYDCFLWFYVPMLITSPLLTIICCYRLALKQNQQPWLLTMAISTIGFSPVWLTYLSLTSFWNTRDLLLVFLTPPLLGIIGYGLTKIAAPDIGRKNNSR